MELPTSSTTSRRDARDHAGGPLRHHSGTLLADASSTYYRVGGLLLTGNFKLHPRTATDRRAPEVTRSHPDRGADTFTTAIKVSSLEGTLAPENSRKIAAASGSWKLGWTFRAPEAALDLRPTGDPAHVRVRPGPAGQAGPRISSSRRAPRSAFFGRPRFCSSARSSSSPLGNPEEIGRRSGTSGFASNGEHHRPLRSERRELYAKTTTSFGSTRDLPADASTSSRM